MQSHVISLIQMPGSPLMDLTVKALNLAEQSHARVTDYDYISRKVNPFTLFLWDLSGFSAEETGRIMELMHSRRLKVLLTWEDAAAPDPDMAQAPPVLGLIPAPQNAQILGQGILAGLSRFQKLVRLETRCEELSGKLAERDIIEKAVSLLISLRGLEEARAMKTMQDIARHYNLELVEVAARLVKELKNENLMIERG